MTNWLSKAFRSKKRKKPSAPRSQPIPTAGADLGIIVDVGLHLGEDAEYYARRGYTVIGYEANPDLCEIAAKKLEGLDVEIKNAAVSDTPDSEVTFFVNTKIPVWSSLDRTLGERGSGAREITVKTIDLAKDLAPVADKLHYVKIDIEGYDFVALSQLMSLDARPPYLSLEGSSEELLDYLFAQGYREFQLVNQKFVQHQKVKPDSPHGAYLDWDFSFGSSGTFGEDLPGKWLSIEDAKRVSTAIVKGFEIAPGNLFAEAVGWFDLHAKHGSASGSSS